ncbi:FecCD family ABC transporter permease [Methanoplanus endosymbiosus]|uniref:Cobalamin import system permease protein BtuC n=1 Tax=Methanoplanus endosymbiosus TaxID=33865 RepID=A0A9E7PQZ5_9EURY|nr:iron ABC transporter permease [Methanoplanus endosymbiosus]UUX93246.1 iron ABC transporter permease [Methanoplanus endosymbiosus]
MNTTEKDFNLKYKDYILNKKYFLLSSLILTLIIFIISISLGAVRIPIHEVISAFTGNSISEETYIIIRDVRLPQACAALIAGIALSLSGVAMQAVLKNPLGSPFTLGLSHAAAFGAAMAVIIFGTGMMTSGISGSIVINNPYITSAFAFLFCMTATGLILGISNLKSGQPETIVLAGIAIGSLFTAATMALQYFADDTQLASIIFWTFGDTGRAGWNEIIIMLIPTITALVYFQKNSMDYNAISLGDEVAHGLGINVKRKRLTGMVISSLVTAVVVSFLGVIGFIGLISPHIARMLIGGDHRYLIPASCITGAAILLCADTAARMIMAPFVIPVAVLTSFIGAPLFLFILFRNKL